MPYHNRCIRFFRDIPIRNVRLAQRRNDAARTAPQPPRAIMLYRASLIVASALSLPAYAQQPIIYPSGGQSAEQQQKDQGECMAWAQQTTGVNPAAVAPGSGGRSAAIRLRCFFQDERVQGAVVGASGRRGHRRTSPAATRGRAPGSAPSSAHWPAGRTGSKISTRRRPARSANQQQAQQSLATYNRAYGACLEGRGYTVR